MGKLPPEQPNPETFEFNREQIRKQLTKALKKGGIDIPSAGLLDALTKYVVEDRIALRKRIAEDLVGTLINRGDDVNTEQLERLAYIIEFHYVDDEGNIQISFPDDE